MAGGGAVAQNLSTLEPQPHELLISIRNDKPVPAAWIGELFSALARDYRQLNRGRTLVVARVATGSWLIFLGDMAQLASSAAPYAANAVEVAKGGKAILDFGKEIRDALSSKKTSVRDGREPTTGSPYRSVEALVKVAAESGAHIRVRQTGADGSSIDVELSPAEAAFIKAQSNQARHDAALAAPEHSHQLAAPRVTKAVPATEAADRLQRIAQSGSGESYVVAQAIAEALRLSGGDHLVEQVALQLEGREYFDLAARIRGFGRGQAKQTVTTI